MGKNLADTWDSSTVILLSSIGMKTFRAKLMIFYSVHKVVYLPQLFASLREFVYIYNNSATLIDNILTNKSYVDITSRYGYRQRENTASRLFTEVKPCWTGLISRWVTILCCIFALLWHADYTSLQTRSIKNISNRLLQKPLSDGSQVTLKNLLE